MSPDKEKLWSAAQVLTCKLPEPIIFSQNVRLLVGKMVADITMPPRSMQTFLYQIQ